eukprot:XP_011450924.1 PREDICTED: multiple epidermal growth factor-like domains protein 10 isoform X2 [Crassostrea gigas]
MRACIVISLIVLLIFVNEASSFVNLVHDQGLYGAAAMSLNPANPAWIAGKAIDGNTNQNYTSNSCAITDIPHHHTNNESVWWKVWLDRPFNVAYLEIFFESKGYQNATGFSIYTYDTQVFYPLIDPEHLVYQHDPMSGCPASVMNITVNRVTQGIVYINKRPPGFTTTCKGADTAYTSINICEVKIMGCDQSKYGVDCRSDCPQKCKHYHCDAFNGSCIHGCSDSQAVSSYCIECKHGTFALNGVCVNCQGHCKDDAYCNTSTGGCDGGCDTHWQGRYCQDCVQGFYGDNCEKQCGECKIGSTCNTTSGLCPNGCKDNWTPPFCTECESNRYGPNCSNTCGHCKDGKACSTVTGACNNGCEYGWVGKQCDTECGDGTYVFDDKCVKCHGLCKNSAPCNKSTGNCDNGCNDHWTGNFCNVCSDGTYVSEGNCVKCQGVCKDHAPCNKSTGTCDNGCSDHWTGTFCEECLDGFYNTQCSGVCGSCVNGDVCEKIGGHCVNGCMENYQGPLCRDCVPGFFGKKCLQKCGKCKSGEACNTLSGLCPDGCEGHLMPPFCKECGPYKYGVNCTLDCGHCKHSVPCSVDTGNCSTGCQNGWSGAHCTVSIHSVADTHREHGLNPAVPILSSVLGITLIVLIIFFVRYFRQRTTSEGIM